MIEVKILADSTNLSRNRITSWLLKYPRFIHSEFMTHRVFSRNAASSRAIPFSKMIAAIQEEPALPEFWAAEHKGMKATESLQDEDLAAVRFEWGNAQGRAVDMAKILSNMALAKSLCNRLIEPYSHITVLATATDHRNFFALRAHPDAMPEFQVLAYRMLDAYIKSEPTQKSWGQWHVPIFDGTVKMEIDDLDSALKVATARCARLSYLAQDGNHDPAKDIALHDRLLASGHLSPFEHCAQASQFDGPFNYQWSNFDVCGQASEWRQYRKQFAEENRTCVDFGAILANKPEWITL